MTQNQLAYQANLEKARANRAQEEIGRAEARAALSKADTAKKEADTKAIDVASQVQRRKVQSGTDIANSVISGISSVGKLAAAFI